MGSHFGCGTVTGWLKTPYVLVIDMLGGYRQGTSLG
jgi:hypothetical protein